MLNRHSLCVPCRNNYFGMKEQESKANNSPLGLWYAVGTLVKLRGVSKLDLLSASDVVNERGPGAQLMLGWW